VPEPVVKIDNESDPFATIVSIEYGDRLGELLDTVSALLLAGWAGWAGLLVAAACCLLWVL
jgi:hypothetical protein